MIDSENGFITATSKKERPRTLAHHLKPSIRSVMGPARNAVRIPFIISPKVA